MRGLGESEGREGIWILSKFEFSRLYSAEPRARSLRRPRTSSRGGEAAVIVRKGGTILAV